MTPNQQQARIEELEKQVLELRQKLRWHVLDDDPPTGYETCVVHYETPFGKKFWISLDYPTLEQIHNTMRRS